MKLRSFRPLAIVAISVVGALSSFVAYAASTDTESADATTTILADLTATKTQDLAFGTGAASDGAKTINPASDTTNSAAFSLTGGASATYTITLPSSVNMTTAGGGTDAKTIVVNSFTSSPSGTGTLSGGGTGTVYVGATRAAIRADQVTGAYSGTFTVTFTYQ